LAEELVGKIDELIDVLKTIDDKESAEDAKGDLESIVEDINDIGKRLKDLERDMTMEERMESATKLVEEHTLDMVKAANALKMEMQRIENSSYADEIGKILQSIDIPR
jgi:cob(I)alamin adenosyltransferase|tara:strand:+ start:641 stop:964 length:324 start_codon:yes stop_codon:yes gene_type:complete